MVFLERMFIDVIRILYFLTKWSDFLNLSLVFLLFIFGFQSGTKSRSWLKWYLILISVNVAAVQQIYWRIRSKKLWSKRSRNQTIGIQILYAKFSFWSQQNRHVSATELHASEHAQYFAASTHPLWHCYDTPVYLGTVHLLTSPCHFFCRVNGLLSSLLSYYFKNVYIGR